MDENRKGDVLVLLLIVAVVGSIVLLAIIMAPLEAAEKQRKEMIYNRVLEIVNAKGVSYNLTTPEYDKDTGVYCKSFFCLDEEDWLKVNKSLQQSLEYLNQTDEHQCLYVLKVEIAYPTFQGGTITDDILRVGVVRNTFQGKQIFDGIDINY
jgi:hypothetical protein